MQPQSTKGTFRRKSICQLVAPTLFLLLLLVSFFGLFVCFTFVVRTRFCYEHFHKGLLLEISSSHIASNEDTQKETDESTMSTSKSNEDFFFHLRRNTFILGHSLYMNSFDVVLEKSFQLKLFLCFFCCTAKKCLKPKEPEGMMVFCES